jgi:hypothetical protein
MIKPACAASFASRQREKASAPSFDNRYTYRSLQGMYNQELSALHLDQLLHLDIDNILSETAERIYTFYSIGH